MPLARGSQRESDLSPWDRSGVDWPALGNQAGGQARTAYRPFPLEVQGRVFSNLPPCWCGHGQSSAGAAGVAVRCWWGLNPTMIRASICRLCSPGSGLGITFLQECPGQGVGSQHSLSTGCVSPWGSWCASCPPGDPAAAGVGQACGPQTSVTHGTKLVSPTWAQERWQTHRSLAPLPTMAIPCTGPPHSVLGCWWHWAEPGRDDVASVAPARAQGPVTIGTWLWTVSASRCEGVNTQGQHCSPSVTGWL